MVCSRSIRRALALALALLASLVALTIAGGADARVGLAEWRIELPGGLVVDHGDAAPDACGSICIHDPRTQQIAVADVEEFKIYDDVVVGTTTHGEYFRVDEATHAVERFASREGLARRMDLGRSTELGRLQKLFMVDGGYALASLALLHGLFSVLARRTRRERPIERRVELYVAASALAPLLGALGFLVIPYLDQDWMGLAALGRGEMFLYFALIHYVPALVGVGFAGALAIPVTLAGVQLAARLRVPPRFTWLVSYVVCHVLVLRFTVGEYLVLFNPYWRGGL
jgi:hypothetical protein